MWPNPQETVDLVTFTEEIFNGKLQFFLQCSLGEKKAQVTFSEDIEST